MSPAVGVRSAGYRAPRWLRNPHLQSVLSSSLRQAAGLRMLERTGATTTEHIVDAGDGVRLLGLHSSLPHRKARGMVLLLHGWEGSADSTYLLSLSQTLFENGFEVVRLNLRDHGATHHLNRELFHSCRIDEVVGALAEVATRFAPSALGIAGFSLGGNFALRVALRAPAAGIPLAWVFAVCPVISPHAGLASIESAPWFYETYFLRKWRRSLQRKQAHFPDAELFSRSELRGSLRALTRDLVLRHTDFGSLDNSLAGSSIAGDRLAALTIPATILTAADDPVIPVANFRELTLAADTELTIVPHGGHCGFIRDLSLRSWAEDFLVARMGRHVV